MTQKQFVMKFMFDYEVPEAQFEIDCCDNCLWAFAFNGDGKNECIPCFGGERWIWHGYGLELAIWGPV